MKSRRFPGWFILIVMGFVALSGYFVLRGLGAFAATGGVMPVNSDATSSSLANQSYAPGADAATVDIASLSPLATSTVARVCIPYKVKVSKGRIRDCPKDTCNTLALPDRGTVICVYGQNTDGWYEVNVNPNSAFPQIGYMSQSILAPLNPTARSSATLALVTVTPQPSLPSTATISPMPVYTIAPTLTIPPTNTPRARKP